MPTRSLSIIFLLLLAILLIVASILVTSSRSQEIFDPIPTNDETFAGPSESYVTTGSSSALTNERVLTNTPSVTWDTSTPGQVKATASVTVGDGDKGDITVSSSGTVWTITKPTSFQFGTTTTNSTTTPATITGFTIPVTSGNNLTAHCKVITDADAATTGVQITFAGPTATRNSMRRRSCTSSTSTTNFFSNSYGADNRTASGGTDRCVEEWDFFVQNATNGTDITATVDSEVDTAAVNVYEESECEYRTW